MTAPHALPDGKVLVLRACHADRKSGANYRPFTWPAVGAEAVAEDWSPEAVCGHGLHGWLWGVGSVTNAGAEWSFVEKDVVWLVVEVDAATVVLITDGAKCKFPRGTIVFEGTVGDCVALIAPHAPAGSVFIAGTANAGYAGTANAGYAGTANAGDAGTANAGDAGTANAGARGTANAGYAGTANAGDAGTANAGARGTANAGYAGTANAGDAGTANAGARGTANAGYAGTANAGYAGTANAGYAGTANAGENGIVVIRWWDSESSRHRLTVGYPGEDGIEAKTDYVLDENHKLVKKVKP